MTNQPRIIKGLRDCADYLTSIGLTVNPTTLKKYIKAGLPCYFEFGTYHFHTDVIDDYFKARCRVVQTNVQDEVENGEA